MRINMLSAIGAAAMLASAPAVASPVPDSGQYNATASGHDAGGLLESSYLDDNDDAIRIGHDQLFDTDVGTPPPDDLLGHRDLTMIIDVGDAGHRLDYGLTADSGASPGHFGREDVTFMMLTATNDRLAGAVPDILGRGHLDQGAAAFGHLDSA